MSSSDSNLRLLPTWALVALAVTLSSSTVKTPAIDAPTTNITEPTFGPPTVKAKVRQMGYGGMEDAFLGFMLAENASPYTPKHAGTLGLLDTLGAEVYPTAITARRLPVGELIGIPDDEKVVGHIIPHERLFAALQQSTAIDLKDAELEIVRDRVVRLKSKLESDNNTLFVITDHGVVAVTNLATFQASPFEAEAIPFLSIQKIAHLRVAPLLYLLPI